MSVGDGEHYVIIGRPESGYSMKVRSAIRYKGVAYEWMDRCLRTKKLFQAHAQVQLIPLVSRPDGGAVRDSTPILEELEERPPEPSLHPSDPGLRTLSELLEEYGDEWANKLMLHHRWGCRTDREHRSGTLARGMLEGHPLRIFAPLLAPFIVRRMVPRTAFAGANENNAPILVESFANLVSMLEAHLAYRPYLFGSRPAFGDFGPIAPFYGHLGRDPNPLSLTQSRAVHLFRWVERMNRPEPDCGKFVNDGGALSGDAFAPNGQIPETLVAVLREFAVDFVSETIAAAEFINGWLGTARPRVRHAPRTRRGSCELRGPRRFDHGPRAALSILPVEPGSSRVRRDDTGRPIPGRAATRAMRPVARSRCPAAPADPARGQPRGLGLATAPRTVTPLTPTVFGAPHEDRTHPCERWRPECPRHGRHGPARRGPRIRIRLDLRARDRSHRL
jgi:glutathione S-transferase